MMHGMVGFYWSWSIFGMGVMAVFFVVLAEALASLRRTGKLPWDSIKYDASCGKVLIYLTQILLRLSVGGFASVIAMNMPTWLPSVVASITPEVILALLGARSGR